MSDIEFRAEQEQHARIRQMWADIELKEMDRLKRRQDHQFAPWALVISGMTAGAAFLAAGAGMMAILIKWLQH